MNKYIPCTQIKERRGQRQLYIHPYKNLFGVSKGLYIKGYDVNFIIILVYHIMYLNVKISYKITMEIRFRMLTDT